MHEHCAKQELFPLTLETIFGGGGRKVSIHLEDENNPSHQSTREGKKKHGTSNKIKYTNYFSTLEKKDPHNSGALYHLVAT